MRWICLTWFFILLSPLYALDPTFAIPSKTFSDANGIETIDFKVGLNAHLADLPSPYNTLRGWDAAAMAVRIDTRYVDLIFKHKTTGVEHRLSEGAASLSNYLRYGADIPPSLVGGNIIPTGSPTQFDIVMVMSIGENNGPDITSNLWRTNLLTAPIDDQYIKAEINKSAIAALPEQRYQIEYILSDKTFIRVLDANCGVTLCSFNGVIQGGAFTFVPEPTPFMMTALLVSFILVIRKRE